jgi:hypothetical protein
VTWITLGNENHDSLISKSANHRPKLREHLGAVAAIMKLSTDWHDFRAKLNKLHPPIGKPTQLSMEFADEKETDTGKGL